MDRKEIWNRRIVPILELFASPYSVLRRIYPQLGMLGIVVYILSLVFVYYQHLDWISAIYAAVNVVTTVGLYAPDINTMPPQEKLFLTVIIIFSVGLFASMAQTLISTIVNRNTWIDARARWRGKHMKGHIVVIGNSKSIISTARKLDELGKDYIVVTDNEEIYNSLKSDKVIFGDPKDEKNLIEAGIRDAESAIISMDNDSDTLLVTLKVQRLNPPLITVVAVKDTSMVDVMKTAGADIVLPYEDIVGRMIASASITSQFAGMIFPTKSREFAIGVFEVKKRVKLKDLPDGVIPIAIMRNGKLDPYFQRDSEVKEGEVLFVLGDPSKFRDVNRVVS